MFEQLMQQWKEESDEKEYLNDKDPEVEQNFVESETKKILSKSILASTFTF